MIRAFLVLALSACTSFSGPSDCDAYAVVDYEIFVLDTTIGAEEFDLSVVLWERGLVDILKERGLIPNDCDLIVYNLEGEKLASFIHQ